MAAERQLTRTLTAPDRQRVARPPARVPVVSPSVPVAQALQRRLGNQGAATLLTHPALKPPNAAPHVATTHQTDRLLASTLSISSPSDPSEREATATASAVMRMPEPNASASPAEAGVQHTNGSAVQRQDGDARAASGSLASDIRSSVSGGAPLPRRVRSFMEPRFRADFSGVRVHTGDRAAALNTQVNAKAFTVGSNIFFGKDAFQPETSEGKELIAHELTHTIQQGATVQRSAVGPVTQRVPTRIQRWGVSDALDFFADKANVIPGFRMFTIILGVNPINMSRVDRSAANILRALSEFMPGGGLITQALDNSGVFDKVGQWVEQQIATLGMTGATIKKSVTAFLDSLSWRDVFRLDDVWERAKRIFTEPIDRLITFAKNLVTSIIKFIKDAILLPLARLAEGTRGWDLLIAVLGQNPITGEPVPRTAQTLIPGFLKLIGQEQVWENMQKSGAIPRAWAWFQGALATVKGFVAQIPTLALNAFKSLELADIVIVPRAFAKVAAVFGNFILNFITWAGTAVWTLLEIIFDVVSPGAWSYIKKTGSAIKSILKNPLPFIGNLVKAAKLGFVNFGENFLTHLKAGLLDWLTGSLPGIYIPQSFALVEIAKFALSVLGLTWENIRAKLVKVVGEPAVKAMEVGFTIVVKLVKEGPAAAWEEIKSQLANLKDMVIGGITDFVVETVVQKAIPKLIAMFIPGAGFISAIVSIYETIMVFVNKIAKIIQVVTAFIDSIVAIAGGAITAAAKRVETILAGLLSLAINFLAGFIGLGKVADKIMGVINKVRAPIDKAIDWLINWIVTMAKKLFAKAFGKDAAKDDKRDFRVRAKEELASKFKGELTRTSMQTIVNEVYAKYQAEGLKGIVAKHPSGKSSAYEAVLIASSIPVSTAEAKFDIDTADLDLGWGRTSATGVLKVGSKEPVTFGPKQNDGEHHAEENLITEMNANWAQVAAPKSTGITNTLIIHITRSPCGDMPDAPNCARKIRQFVSKWQGKYLLDVEIRAASIYFGKFRKASREAIKKLEESGIKVTAWDLIKEIGDTTEVSKETRDKLQKRIDSTRENLPDIIKVGAGT